MTSVRPYKKVTITLDLGGADVEDGLDQSELDAIVASVVRRCRSTLL